MASGFVSGGTLDTPVERDDEWLAAQKEIEDLRRKRAEESKQNDGRSLFEILEANKGTARPAVYIPIPDHSASKADHVGCR